MRIKRQPKRHLSLAETILREAREELTRADAKSSLLLAAAGVVVGAYAAAVAAGEWSPLELSPCVQWLWWLGTAAGVGSLVAFAYSVYPRTKYRGERKLEIVTYFGDVVITPKDRLESLLIKTAEIEGSRTLDQLKIVSSIVDRKFRGIQVGIWLAAASVLTCSLALVVNYFI